MIDLHCHVLPGVDDGPATLEDALAIVARQAALGVTTVAATSHVDHAHPGNDSSLLAAATAEMQAAAGPQVTLVTGAEVAMTRALELPDDELARLRLGGGPWVLLEAPMGPASGSSVEEALFRLRAGGHQLLLAHPERCAPFQRDPELLRRCVAQGMTTQVTAASFTGRFGRTVQRFAEAMLEGGLVHTVASDAHDAQRRPPGMAADLEAAGHGALVAQLCAEAPAAILGGSPVPPPPVPARRRRWFRRG